MHWRFRHRGRFWCCLLYTSNGTAQLSSVQADRLNVKTSNGEVELEGVSGVEALLKTTNAEIASGDWSSDVCSSDLENTGFIAGELFLIVSLVLYRPISVYEL